MRHYDHFMTILFIFWGIIHHFMTLHANCYDIFIMIYAFFNWGIKYLYYDMILHDIMI